MPVGSSCHFCKNGIIENSIVVNIEVAEYGRHERIESENFLPEKRKREVMVIFQIIFGSISQKKCWAVFDIITICVIYVEVFANTVSFFFQRPRDPKKDWPL